MNSKRFESSSAVLRYFAAVFAVVAFGLMFGTILYNESGSSIKFAELYFNAYESLNIPHVYGFIAQVLTLLAGVFGVLIIVFEQLYENGKKLGIITGGVLVLCGVIFLLSKVLYCAIEVSTNATVYHLYGTTIAAGCLAILAGGMNIWGSLLKE